MGPGWDWGSLSPRLPQLCGGYWPRAGPSRPALQRALTLRAVVQAAELPVRGEGLQRHGPRPAAPPPPPLTQAHETSCPAPRAALWEMEAAGGAWTPGAGGAGGSAPARTALAHHYPPTFPPRAPARRCRAPHPLPCAGPGRWLPRGSAGRCSGVGAAKRPPHGEGQGEKSRGRAGAM